MTNYEYTCAMCGTESIVKKPASEKRATLAAACELYHGSISLSRLHPGGHHNIGQSHSTELQRFISKSLLLSAGGQDLASSSGFCTLLSLVLVSPGLTPVSLVNFSPPPPFPSLSQEIIPFVQEHWEAICTKRSKAASWKINLSTKMVGEREAGKTC